MDWAILLAACLFIPVYARLTRATSHADPTRLEVIQAAYVVDGIDVLTLEAEVEAVLREEAGQTLDSPAPGP